METTQGSSAPGAQDKTPPAQGDRDNGYCNHRGRHGHKGRRFFFVLLVALVAGGVGGYIGKSFAHGGQFSMGMRGMAGDPAKMDEHVERMVQRFASKVDATPEQQQKLAAIAKGAAKDIAPVRDKLRDARRQAFDIARAPTVDRAAMEKLRAEQVQLADAVSRRMTQALGDAAEVLTPEQRQKITGRMAERMDRRGHGEHGWGRG